MHLPKFEGKEKGWFSKAIVYLYDQKFERQVITLCAGAIDMCNTS